MQSVSMMHFDPQETIRHLEAHPISQRDLKIKLDRIFAITASKEHFYLPDIRELYQWLVIFNRHRDFRDFIQGDKAQKDFITEIMSQYIKYLMCCKQFRLNEVMILCKQIYIESLNFFIRYFGEVDKYPQMINIIKVVLDLDRHFYKLNHQDSRLHLIPPLEEKQQEQLREFTQNLTVGQVVDAIKAQMGSKRKIWSPATIIKVGSQLVTVSYFGDKPTIQKNISKYNFQIFPAGTMTKDSFQWRKNIQIGDQIDYEYQRYVWKKVQVLDIAQRSVQEKVYKMILVNEPNGKQLLISPFSPFLQPPNLFSSKNVNNQEQQLLKNYDVIDEVDDFNDILLERIKYTKAAVLRNEISSTFYIELVNHFQQIDGFELIVTKILNPSTHIDIIQELLHFTTIISVVFHRRFALDYLPRLCDAVTNSLINCPESSIRVFTKDKFNSIMENLSCLRRRFMSFQETKQKIQDIVMIIIKKFIDSEFLDRKLNSLALLTDLIKGDSSLRMNSKKLESWFVQNDIINKIYHESSHPELISRSSQLFKLYLASNPSEAILEPLLTELSEPIIKVIYQNIQALPAEFLRKVASKLTSDAKIVLTEEVISILKVVGGYQLWTLQRGGYGWVQLVKSKKSKKSDFQQLFSQSLDVICKVFVQMNEKDLKLSQIFMNYANSLQFVPKLIQSNIDISKKLQFLKHFFRELDEVDDSTLNLFSKLWDQTYQMQNNRNFLQTFKNIINVLQTRQYFVFAKNCFTSQKLRHLSLHAFIIFKKVITQINSSDLDFMNISETPYGVDKILEIVFENQKLEVTKKALQFIFLIIDQLKSQAQITKFKQDLLQKCLSRLYETQNFQKYLTILEGILDESEKNGNGGLQPLARQLPPLPISFGIINHFNSENRTRFTLTVNSNITLYQFRHVIGQHVNAYGYQLKLYSYPNNILIEELQNSLTLQQAGLNGTILVMRKYKIKRVDLTKNNKLVPEAIRIITNVFNDYSIDGFMSKENCRRLTKRVAGDSTFLINSKVDKIFENYDTDKDGQLKLEDLISYYQHIATVKTGYAWNHLEALGARQDLKILNNVELTQPDPKTLPRYLLLNNNQFMQLLFNLISQDCKSSQASWNFLFRLPISATQVKKNTKYQLRYWLYQQDYNNQDKLDSQTFSRIVEADQQTLLMGLKIAEKINFLTNIQQLQVILNKIKGYNQQNKMSIMDQLILAFGLKIICKGLQKSGDVQKFLLQGEFKIEELFMNGLLSKNKSLRHPYLEAIMGMLKASRNENPEMFKRLYIMLEKGLQRELTFLTPEYFELFSQVLILATNIQLLTQQVHSILDKIVLAFKSHHSTQFNLTSKEDYISIGFIKLIKGFFLFSGIQQPGIVTFLFCECLFPNSNSEGTHKLRSHSSRKEAYDLIVTLCKNDPTSLRQLFNCNFKEIYQKTSDIKDAYYISSKIRSEYGCAGIQNLGCICYMIAMIQQFFMIPAFRYLILTADDGVPEDLCKIEQPQQHHFFPMLRSYSKEQRIIDDNVFHQFQLLFANLQLTEKQDVDPENFCLSFKDFEGNSVNVMVQQDAQEFLNMLFDKLQNGLKETPFKNIVNNIYGGKYCNELVCSSCKKVSERHQNFFSLSLEVKGQKDIYESFNKFIEGEVISQYKCEGCNKKADTTKRCYVSQLPNYLILYLQRICFNYDKFENQKVNSRFEFPHDLNIYDYTLQAHKAEAKPTQTSDYQYKLKGIVIHIGSAEYGHYFSYIRGDNGQWLEYNDESVREFDPSDIEDEAFGGGTGWRKDHQSAYLLLYEKVQKSKIKLQFKTKEEKESIIKTLKVKQIINQQNNQYEVQNAHPIQRMEEESLEKNSQKSFQFKEQKSQEAGQTGQISENKQTKHESKEQLIVAYIDPTTVQTYVKPEYKQLINKSNQQFTLNIHLASNQFFEFVYNIVMMDTVPELKNELLLLCSETFPATQPIGSNNLLLSEELPKRFSQLIENVGWEFYLEKRQRWKVQILASESSSRTSTKNVMVATISDIIKHKNQERDEDLTLFLTNFWQMNQSQELQWYIERSSQYFDLWQELLVLHQRYLLPFFQKNKALQTLLRYLINDKNFSSKSSKKKRMFDYNSQQPMSFALKLIQMNYEFDKFESKGISSYSFLIKLVENSKNSSKIISKISRSNSLISERLCYLILNSLTKITHSMESKPLILAVKQLLSVDDELHSLRREWLFGFSQLVQHPPHDSVGLYGLSGAQQQIRTYYSPLGAPPITKTLYGIKEKYQHITVLLITMMLDIEKDGLINLGKLPSIQPLFQDYTHWFGDFIQNYKNAEGHPYREYASNVTNLWNSRKLIQNKQENVQYLVGKTLSEKINFKYPIDKEQKKPQEYCYMKPELEDREIQIQQSQITINIVKAQFDQNGYLKNADNILYKSNPVYFAFEQCQLDALQNSHQFLRKISDVQSEEENKTQQIESPFKESFKSNYIRKLKISNPSQSPRTVTLKLCLHDENDNNIKFPKSACRFSLQQEQDIIFIIEKKNPAEKWPQYTIKWDQVIDKPKKLNIFKNEQLPKQILTAESESDEEETQQQEDDEEDYWPQVQDI